MADYTSTLVNELCRVLDHAVGLPLHRFAGYVANFEFWLEEYAHCMSLLNGYDLRFDQLSKAVKSQAAQNASSFTMGEEGEFEAYAVVPNPPVRRSLNPQELWELSDSLSRSVKVFVKRALRDSLIGKEELTETVHRHDQPSRIWDFVAELE